MITKNYASMHGYGRTAEVSQLDMGCPHVDAARQEGAEAVWLGNDLIERQYGAVV